jgi:hypothetical protein
MPVAALLFVLAAPPPADTIRVEVGSPAVDGRVYRPHRARVRIYQGSTDSKPVNEWTNELAIGDSAGRAVMRWTTLGQFDPVTGKPGYELLQTYDHRTMAPLGWSLTNKAGARIRLSLDGNRLRGTRRTAADTTTRQVDETIGRLGFVASASDLVPLAVGLKEGRVIIAPVWGPNMATAETRIFSILGRESMRIEGAEVSAWRVEERRESDRALLATWFLTDTSPYMVGGESILPNGQVQKYTEVALP